MILEQQFKIYAEFLKRMKTHSPPLSHYFSPITKKPPKEPTGGFTCKKDESTISLRYFIYATCSGRRIVFQI